ncbi:MAG: tRNA lysidine(34) synthetase TilS [Tatlockia sp.]|nr:tRNA lysidine(34) synthetase TilS [Tatlockia sp.]
MIRLSAYWLEHLGQYDRLFVGYSGGLDSTVLLHHLAAQPALVKKLLAVHINHGLSANALNWQNHCQQVCNDLGIRLIVKQVVLAKQTNLEEEARKVRYEAFASLLASKDCLILAHHLDDQAETLLLQLFRGTGIDGLAAMAAQKEFDQANLLRPFLEFSRQDLEKYAQIHKLEWVDDESNQNTSFSRNYLRHQVLPLIRDRWPAVVNNLVRTTNHCQQAQSNLEALAKIDCPTLNAVSTTLPLASLSTLNSARISNVLRYWFKSNKVKIPDTLSFNRLLTEVIQARKDASPEVIWKGFSVRRYQQRLYLSQAEEEEIFPPINWPHFPEPLDLKNLGKLVVKEAVEGFLLSTPGPIEIRFRQGGELFKWHGQIKHLKKLLQKWQVPPWLRGSIPLLFVNGQLAVIVGYAVSDLFYGKIGKNCSPLELVLKSK